MELPQKKFVSPAGLAIPVLIAALGLLAGYLIYSQWLADGGELMLAPALKPNDRLAKFRDSGDFDFNFFNTGAFKSLKLLGEVPVQPGPTGKQDLFAPF